MRKATLLLALCLASCGGSDQQQQADGERFLNEAALTSAFAGHDLSVTPAAETGNTDEVCTLFLGHDPGTQEERIFYVWLFKTHETAENYESPELSPIVNPAAIRRIRNVVIYVPRDFSHKGEGTLEAVERELEQRASPMRTDSVCDQGTT